MQTPPYGDRGPAIGTPALQRVNGTRQVYGADIGLVVTNGRFTTRCPPLRCSCTCTSPTGAPSPPGPAADAPYGNSSRSPPPRRNR
ncbi:hypothetical protein [Streptomyces sp. ID05-18]|uniref:hypothetical protein n=1 Tax=Streptomyces sp. ID05-18 TaxID=3028662 RepID=UPI003A5BE4A7